MRPFRNLYKTFTAEKVSFTKVIDAIWKGLVKVTINPSLLNLNGPMEWALVRTFSVLVSARCMKSGEKGRGFYVAGGQEVW